MISMPAKTMALVLMLFSLWIKPAFAAQTCTQAQQQKQQMLEHSLLKLSGPLEQQLKEKQKTIHSINELINTANKLLEDVPVKYMGRLYHNKASLQQQIQLLKENHSFYKQQSLVLQQQLNTLLARLDAVQWQMTLCDDS